MSASNVPVDRRSHWGWKAITGPPGFDWCLRGPLVVVRHKHRGEGCCLWQDQGQKVNSLDPLDLETLVRMPCEVCGHIKNGAWEEAPFRILEVLP